MLLLGLAGGGLHRVEGEVPHIEKAHVLPQHALQIRSHILRGAVVRAENKEGKAAPIPEGGGQIGPMHRRKPGNERRKSSALQQTREGGGFLVFKYLIQKHIHSRGIITDSSPGRKGEIRSSEFGVRNCAGGALSRRESGSKTAVISGENGIRPNSPEMAAISRISLRRATARVAPTIETGLRAGVGPCSGKTGTVCSTRTTPVPALRTENEFPRAFYRFSIILC